jgi:hypothetical protein
LARPVVGVSKGELPGKYGRQPQAASAESRHPAACTPNYVAGCYPRPAPARPGPGWWLPWGSVLCSVGARPLAGGGLAGKKPTAHPSLPVLQSQPHPTVVARRTPGRTRSAVRPARTPCCGGLTRGAPPPRVPARPPPPRWTGWPPRAALSMRTRCRPRRAAWAACRATPRCAARAWNARGAWRPTVRRHEGGGSRWGWLCMAGQRHGCYE